MTATPIHHLLTADAYAQLSCLFRSAVTTFQHLPGVSRPTSTMSSVPSPSGGDMSSLSSSKSAPAVNVWHVRKEQLARTQAVASPFPTSVTQPSLASSAHTSRKPSPKGANGVDSSVTRPPVTSTSVDCAPSSAKDEVTWPEVGKSISSSPANGPVDGGEKREEGSISGSGSRRSTLPVDLPSTISLTLS